MDLSPSTNGEKVMPFKAEVKTTIGWDWNEGAVDNGRLDYARQILCGNGSGQAEAVWHAENQTLAGGTSTVLDLQALGRMILGVVHTISFLTIKNLLIVNSSTGAGTLVLGGATSNQWSAPFGDASDKIAVPPESPLLLGNRITGWPVDAESRCLQIAAVGGDVTYSIAVVGTITPIPNP
jgi:hypothetical protein